MRYCTLRPKADLVRIDAALETLATKADLVRIQAVLPSLATKAELGNKPSEPWRVRAAMAAAFTAGLARVPCYRRHDRVIDGDRSPCHSCRRRPTKPCVPPGRPKTRRARQTRTMVKVCKPDGEGTIAGRRGNGEVAPIPAVRRTIGTDGGRPISVIPRCYGDHPKINLWWALSITV